MSISYLLLGQKNLLMTKIVKKVGIDISKANFDVAYIEKEKIRTKKYSYTAADIKQFIASLDSDSQCVMEATGIYHLRLAHALYDAGIGLCVVNPLSVKRFIQSKMGLNLLKKQLKFVENQLKQIEAELGQLIENDEDVTNIQTIPGIGRKTAIALMVYTKGMQSFDNHRKVSSYFGLSPRIVQSGSSVKGRGSICKMGMGHMRMLLYMCARSAKKYNKSCRELYERLLAKGKAKKLALIAVANKLVKQVFAIVKNKSKYVENFA